MLTRVFRVLLLSLLLIGIDCRAEETYDSFVSLQLENDLWGSNDDRFYTHGSKFSWATSEPAPEFLLSLTELLPFYKSGPIERHGFEIGQAIFTPEDIEATALIEDDRPYASWLYLNTGIGHVYWDRGDRDRLNMLLLTIGIVGPSSLGEETQEAVHSVFDNTDPRGWDNQLEDELGLNFTFLNKSRRIYGFDENWQTELGLHNNFTLGNVYTYAAVGITARFGTHLKNDIGPPSILPGFPRHPNLQSQSEIQLVSVRRTRGSCNAAQYFSRRQYTARQPQRR